MASNGTEKQAVAAVAIAAGATSAAAAEVAGVGVRTVARWRSDGDFQAMVRNHRSRLVEETLGVLLENSRAAAEQLVELAVGRHSNASVRLGAIRSVLTFSHEMLTVEALISRIEALEARL